MELVAPESPLRCALPSLLVPPIPAVARAVPAGRIDPELIIRAQEGDERAFAEVATILGGRLQRAAYGILCDPARAQAAVQAALIQVWRKLPSLRDVTRFDAWSSKSLVDACRAEAKRAIGRRSGTDEVAVTQPSASSTGHMGEGFEPACRNLSLDERIVLVLRHYLDLEPQGVADALGIDLAALTSWLDRAVAAAGDRLTVEPTSERAASPGGPRPLLGAWALEPVLHDWMHGSLDGVDAPGPGLPQLTGPIQRMRRQRDWLPPERSREAEAMVIVLRVGMAVITVAAFGWIALAAIQ